jgi:hypothetical protein
VTFNSRDMHPHNQLTDCGGREALDTVSAEEKLYYALISRILNKFLCI